MAEVDEVWKELSLEMEEEEAEHDTLNGFLIYKLDKIPQDNEVVEITYKGYLFSSLKVENKTIQLVKAIRLKEEEGLEEEE